jgi:Bacterial Ig-like domain (group 2)
MTNRFLRSTLPVCVAVLSACGSDEAVLAPEKAPAVLSSLSLLPARVILDTVAPGNTLRLSVWATDQYGSITERTDVASYSSAASEIAAVSSGGIVTAATPGTAQITATVTLGGVTRSASTTVLVRVHDDSETSGVYDLSAVVGPPNDWGYEGYRYTAVVTLQEEPGPDWISGTYTDLRFVAPEDGTFELLATSGVITGTLDSHGQKVIQLGTAHWSGLQMSVSSVAGKFIDGEWGCCDSFTGSFTFERR